MKLIRRTLWAVAGVLLFGGIVAAQEPVDYGRDIVPIFKRSCYSCHGNPETDIAGRSKKAKGGVRLDGRHHITAPRRSGEQLFKAKDVAGSLLYELISLPADDPDIMPPDDSPLKADELALIKRWIEEGADFGTWMGTSEGTVETKDEKPTEPARPSRLAEEEALLVALARDLKPVPDEKLKAIAGELAQIESIDGRLPLYRVSFNSHQESVTDATLKSLGEIGAQIVDLRLSGTRVSDAGMKSIAAMPRLMHLDLGRTEVGNAGLEKLGGLRELKSLNLLKTRVDDAGLPLVVGLPKLEKLYLWKSAATDAGVATLEKRLPKLAIYFRPRLPDPDTDLPAPQRRRN